VAGVAASGIASAAVDGIAATGRVIAASGRARAVGATTDHSNPAIAADVPDTLALRSSGGARGTTSSAIASRWVLPEFGWPL
jgi:hypothetical protein